MPLVRKETHYFEYDSNFDRKNRPVDDYSGFHRTLLFLRKISGEATPSYMFYPNCLERIRRYNPQAKIIALLRNPVVRAHSHWALSRKEGFIGAGETFRHTLEAELCAKQRQPIDRVRSNIARGRYKPQIDRILQNFPEVLFVKSEDFYNRQAGSFAKICEFLGVPPIPTLGIHAHSVKRPEPLSRTDWEFALELFVGDIRQVEQSLGWNCSDWLRIP